MASRWWLFERDTGRWSAVLAFGQFRIFRCERDWFDACWETTAIGDIDLPMDWVADYHTHHQIINNGWDLKVVTYVNALGDGGSYRQLSVVLWPIPLLLWTPAALLLRSGILARRRAVKGMCGKCGYSLAGLGEGAACPECGRGAKAGTN